VIDPASLSVLATVPGGNYPDGLDYAPDVGKLYVSDEQGGIDTVIDLRSNQVLGTIPLGGAGNTRFDPASRLIYVAVHDVNQLVAIDPTNDQIRGRIDLPGCDDPHGVAVNPVRRTAFVACEANATLVVVDLQTSQGFAHFPVGRTPDVLAFDSELGRLYVAAESGPLIAFVQDEDGVRLLAQGDLGPNAHSVSVNPTTHHLYLPLQNIGGKPVLREVALDLAAGS
jgi:DNA-binding beta-propeller fold protein YncE